MGLAKYYSKNSLALKQLLNSADLNQFESILNSHVVEIAFDSDCRTFEGASTLDLLIRLISRLYPSIKVSFLDDSVEKVKAELEIKARLINPNIEFSNKAGTIAVVVGKTIYTPKNKKCPVFYVGTDGWFIKHSTSGPVGSGNTGLPYAAGVAACIAASNVFRAVFNTFLPPNKFDENLNYDLFAQHFKGKKPKSLKLTLDNPVLIGFGAIGNGFIWAISKHTGLLGSLTIVDDQELSLSNLQRYVLTTEDQVGIKKVNLLDKAGMVNLVPIDIPWQKYASLNHRNKLNTLIAAVDSDLTRIHIQSYLSKKVFNGYTNNGNLGVSSHLNFGIEACLACDYIPTVKKKDRSFEVAEGLGVLEPKWEEKVRYYLYTGEPVPEAVIKTVAEANGFTFDELSQFVGKSMDTLYADFVCGGIILQKNNKVKTERIDAPLAFESCMAGLLLAMSYIMNEAGFETKSNCITINPLSSWQHPFNPTPHNIGKDNTGRCLCSDEVYLNIYNGHYCT